MEFEQFGTETPDLISFVQHPMKRSQSGYFYQFRGCRFNSNCTMKTVEDYLKACWYWSRKDPQCFLPCGSVIYFCGTDKLCLSCQSESESIRNAVLQKAKRNIETHFKVVGVLEMMQKTLTVFENLLPTYFTRIPQDQEG